jgi:argininosuccinate lyase
MKLWQKSYTLNKEIESFTVGRDYILDLELVPYDCLASKAHARMLGKIGILSTGEVNDLVRGLDRILKLHKSGDFKIRPDDEDCHTAIENFLVLHVGEAGKKIHTGRSRNDQVLTALRMYSKVKLEECIEAVKKTIDSTIPLIDRDGDIPIPGYTHSRKAMPSSVAMWAGAFKDAMTDNWKLLNATIRMIDQNPLGTGAGYGIPLPLDRHMTTVELGFAKIMENPIYAQNSRAKFEGFVLSLLTNIMADINKVASDLIFFTMPELEFFTLPDEFMTGSSIMPQKKNPDVFELLRGKYHELLGYELQVRNTTINLISGYHREIQLTKEPVIRGFSSAIEAIHITGLVFENLTVHKDKCEAAMTKELFATDKAYKLVQQGMPFREAYMQISKEYE